MIPDPVGSRLSPAPYVSDSDTAKMTEQNNLNFRIEELKHRILDLEKVNIKLKEDDLYNKSN